MLHRLARFSFRRRRFVLVFAVLLFVTAGAVGGGVAEELSGGGFEDPNTDSAAADEILQERFGVGVPNVVLLVTANDDAIAAADAAGGPESGTSSGVAVDDAEVQAAGLALTARLEAQPDVVDVVSYWSIGNQAALRSVDGEEALVIARILGDENTVDDRIGELAPGWEFHAGDQIDGQASPISSSVTGFAQGFRETSEQIEADLVRAELIALPITMILLLFVFRGVVAASLPLAIGALTVVNTFLVLRIVNQFTEVSVFALNMVTALGLGLAIDYALFVLNRYREERAAGFDNETAVIRTVRTAGKTVAFSAATVAASLMALLVFPFAFLKSFAYAGLAVGALAGFFSVVVLPAILAALGDKVDALPISFGRREAKPEEEGFWFRTAQKVMRRPVGVTTVVVAFLLFLGLPFLNVNLGLPDDRVLPESAPARLASDLIRDEFTSNEAGASSIVATDIGDLDDPDVQARIDEYAIALSMLDGAERVDAYTGIYADGELVLPGEVGRSVAPELFERFESDTRSDLYVSVVPDHEPNSQTGEDFARAIRDLDTSFDGVLVTGSSAMLADAKDGLYAKVPVALGIIAIVTFALLFMMFGSVLIPIKALILNMLSLTAVFGGMVWIFQEGNLSDLLGFTATGALVASTPILMFCVAFGLSMDYEVFLLSRIKEEHDNGADDVTAVAYGLERTGRIVTAAALLIAVVFLAFGTSEVRFIKLFGLGLAIAVLADAFIIRGTLVPAFMRLAGGANWWAPAPMKRFYERFGISEHVDFDDDETAVDATAEDVTPTTMPAPAPASAAVAAGRAPTGARALAPAVLVEEAPADPFVPATVDLDDEPTIAPLPPAPKVVPVRRGPRPEGRAGVPVRTRRQLVAPTLAELAEQEGQR